MNRELMNLALEALEQHGCPWIRHEKEYNAAIEALKQELAKTEPEPVAWMMVNPRFPEHSPSLHWKPQEWHITWEAVPLYAAPTEPKWSQVSEYHAALQRVEPRRTYAKTEEDTASW